MFRTTSTRARSLNQGAATATAASEPILKVAHLRASLHEKWQWGNAWKISTDLMAILIYPCQ